MLAKIQNLNEPGVTKQTSLLKAVALQAANFLKAAVVLKQFFKQKLIEIQ
jgi:hypothetical protein